MWPKNKTVQNIVLTFSLPCNVFTKYIFIITLLLLSILFFVIFLQILYELITLGNKLPIYSQLVYALGGILLLLLSIMNFLLFIRYIRRDKMLHVHSISFDDHIITIFESKTNHKIIVDTSKCLIKRGRNCFLLFDINRNISYIFVDDFISRLEITPSIFCNPPENKQDL